MPMLSTFPARKYTRAQLGGTGVNLLKYVLGSAVTSSATTFPVSTDPTTKLPDIATNGDLIFGRIGLPGTDAEVVLLTNRDASNIYVKRNADGQGAYGHSADDILYIVGWTAEHHSLIASLLEDIQDQICAVRTTAIDLLPYKCVTYNSSGQFIYAKADTLATSIIVGMTLDGFKAGSEAVALRRGYINNPNWNWNTQKRLWLSAIQDGELSEYEPGSGSNHYSAYAAHSCLATSIDFGPEKSSIAKV